MSPALPFSSVCYLSLAPQVKGHGGQASTDLTGLPSAGRQEKFVLSLLRMEVEKKSDFSKESHILLKVILSLAAWTPRP